MINANSSLCFTGHRPDRIGGYAPNPIQDWVKEALKAIIERALEKDIMNFISGGALGVDQWAAEIVAKMKEKGRALNLCIAKPFPSQASRWEKEAQAQYKNIINKADKIIEISDGGFAAWKMHKRNRWMVDHSKYIVAVWDQEKKGGTWNCLEYAMKKDKRVYIINPLEKRVGWL